MILKLFKTSCENPNFPITVIDPKNVRETAVSKTQLDSGYFVEVEMKDAGTKKSNYFESREVASRFESLLNNAKKGKAPYMETLSYLEMHAKPNIIPV